MKRRNFLKTSLLFPTFTFRASAAGVFQKSDIKTTFKRVRPGEKDWPSTEQWQVLNKAVNGNLIEIKSPIASCQTSGTIDGCKAVFNSLKNPYYIGDNPALTQTTGWLGAWQSEPSVYAVAAKTTDDVMAAINFARVNNLRLAVKGGGHSYQGTSNCADSLLIWTRSMNDIIMHDSFIGKNCEGKEKPQPAVSVGAGAMWIQAYEAVTTKGGRFVQGGGCMTVGVAGLISGGGFGSFSKHYGLAAAALLEAEIITADGVVRIANQYTNPELFWALKGGGGGSFGVVTNLTLRTRELPHNFGAVFGKIKANSDTAFKKLIGTFISFYKDKLFNPSWGEQARFRSDNSLEFSMLSFGMNTTEMQTVWQSFEDSIKADTENYIFESPLRIVEVPARHLWDASFLKKYAGALIAADDRQGASETNIYWAGDGEESGQFLYAYRSAWLPGDLLETNRQAKLVDALFAATRYWGCSLHFNKGLAGAPAEEIAAAGNTAVNPEVLKAFALIIIAGEGNPAFAGVSGYEPDIEEGGKAAERINRSMAEILKAAPGAGSYLSESNFFESDWQNSFWGSHYPRLKEIKTKYDPDGLFIVHHGVGSEEWTADGFTRLP